MWFVLRCWLFVVLLLSVIVCLLLLLAWLCLCFLLVLQMQKALNTTRVNVQIKHNSIFCKNKQRRNIPNTNKAQRHTTLDNIKSTQIPPKRNIHVVVFFLWCVVLNWLFVVLFVLIVVLLLLWSCLYYCYVFCCSVNSHCACVLFFVVLLIRIVFLLVLLFCLCFSLVVLQMSKALRTKWVQRANKQAQQLTQQTTTTNSKEETHTTQTKHKQNTKHTKLDKIKNTQANIKTQKTYCLFVILFRVYGLLFC